jgi:hypothetical protein
VANIAIPVCINEITVKMYWVVIFLTKKPKQDIVNYGMITTKITSFIKASSFTVCTSKILFITIRIWHNQIFYLIFKKYSFHELIISKLLGETKAHNA